MKRHVAGAAVVLLAAVGLASAPIATAIPTAVPGATPDPGTSRSLAAKSAADLVSHRPAALKASADDAFVRLGVTTGGNGMQFVSYDRTHKGVPVVGGDFVVVTDRNGTVTSTSVAQHRVIQGVGTRASVKADQAAAVAKAQLDKVTSADAPRLVVYALGTPRLAWEVTVSGTDAGEASRQSVYVDALNGSVVGTRERIVSGTGTGGYNGPNPLTINTTQSGSTYLLQDPTMTTLKCQDAANNTTYSGPDDIWGNGDVSNKETGCVDALYAGQKQRAMLSSWLGRNGMNGAGSYVPIRVGLNDVNAYYDGTQIQIGHSQTGGRWISSMDVVGHEFGHGIDDTTPGGISRGGTQEFIADVFGAATEGYANQPAQYDPPDYLVGEEIDLVGDGPIRNMYNPSAAGDPNCYSSSIPTMGVHTAAGPGNHWFYLLAEGTNPTNGQPASATCNGSTNLQGVGLQTATKVVYNAMLMKTSTSSYLKYRTWTLTSAKNLDATCALFNKVKAAWDAVSVPAQTADPTCTGGPGAVNVTNPGSKTGTVGTAVTSVQLTASGGSSPYTWTATGLPAGLTISSGGLISGTPTTAGTYSVTATARDTANTTGSTTFTWTINPVATPGCTATNSTPMTIADNSTIESSISITGCTGNASATSTIPVDINHTYKGDLVVTLVAPDGTGYVLHNRTGSGTDNIKQTFTVNLSSEVANGTWKLRVQDAASQDTGTLNSWGVNLGGGTTPTTCTGTNGNDVAIPDNATVSSTIAITGCTGNASSTSKAEVHIVHTYIGDLVVTLVAPDGTGYVMHNRTGSSTDNINQTYTVNLSGEVRNGTWTLRVQDAATADTGRIDTWTLTL